VFLIACYASSIYQQPVRDLHDGRHSALRVPPLAEGALRSRRSPHRRQSWPGSISRTAPLYRQERILADEDPVALDTTYLRPALVRRSRGTWPATSGGDRRAGVAAIGIVALGESASVWRLLCLVVADVVSLTLVQSSLARPGRRPG
jgi:hypothetical protein